MELAYDPPSFRRGLWLALAGVALLAAAVFVSGRFGDA